MFQPPSQTFWVLDQGEYSNLDIEIRETYYGVPNTIKDTGNIKAPSVYL